MNMMNTEMIKGKIIDKKYLEKLKATPRPRQLKAQNQKRAKTPWSLPISIFWGYQGDNTVYIYIYISIGFIEQML